LRPNWACRDLVDRTKRSQNSDNLNGRNVSTFKNPRNPTEDNDHKIKNIPRISQIAVSSHEKAHSNDLENHLHCVNDKEDEIDLVVIFGDDFDFLVKPQKDAVYQDDEHDESIEPGVDSHNLDNLVSKGVCNR